MLNTAETMMTELNAQELEQIAGGTETSAKGRGRVNFVLYTYYVDKLYDKYNCRGKGIRYLKKQCTADEKAKIHDMWHDFIDLIPEKDPA